MIIFIGCGKSKNTKKCKAESMYLGNYFKTCLEYAKFLKGPNDSIYILSANYGVLPLDTVIEPYNKTLNTFSESQYNEWLNIVKNQLNLMNISCFEKVMFLCGKNYYKGLINYFNDYIVPLSSYSGMGYQIKFMKDSMCTQKQHKLF